MSNHSVRKPTRSAERRTRSARTGTSPPNATSGRKAAGRKAAHDEVPSRGEADRSPKRKADEVPSRGEADRGPHGAKRKADEVPSRGEAKRERILDAAVKVFAAEGFYNAKVSQIAQAAGVADGTIYLYFKSKDDLLIQLFEDRMEM